MPPPTTGSDTASGRGRAPHGLALAIEPVVEHFRSRRRPRERAIGVQADEQVGLAVVGGGRALVDADQAVLVAGQDDPHTEASLDERAQPSRDVERQLLFLQAVGAAHTDLVAAVPGVDRQRPQRLPWLQTGKSRFGARDSGRLWTRDSRIGVLGSDGYFDRHTRGVVRSGHRRPRRHRPDDSRP